MVYNLFILIVGKSLRTMVDCQLSKRQYLTPFNKLYAIILIPINLNIESTRLKKWTWRLKDGSALGNAQGTRFLLHSRSLDWFQVKSTSSA